MAYFADFKPILCCFWSNSAIFLQLYQFFIKIWWFWYIFKENSFIFLENVSKPSIFDAKLIEMPKNSWIWSKKTQNWFKISKIGNVLKSWRNLTCLEISYFSVSAILFSFCQNWSSVSAKILSKKPVNILEY